MASACHWMMPDAAANACVKLPTGACAATRNQTAPSTRWTSVPDTAVTTRARRLAMKMRSEERRVGKEWRSGWSPDAEQKYKKERGLGDADRVRRHETKHSKSKSACG